MLHDACCNVMYRPTLILDFGDTELETLVDHFKSVVEASGIRDELIPDQWTVLKALVYQEPQSLQKMSWSSVNRCHQHSCLDLLALVDLVLSFPASTAKCERGFNTMKQVKTDRRSNLKSDTLSDHHYGPADPSRDQRV